MFSRRLSEDPKPGPPVPALIPLLWLPTDVPAHLTHLQYHDRSFGAAYHQHGLRKLLQLQKYGDDYLELLTSVAIRIVATARAHHPPPLAPAPTFADAVNAFAGPATPVAASVPSRPAKLPLISYDENRDEDEFY